MSMDAGEANIFISYATENISFAEKVREELQRELQASEIRIWMSGLIRNGLYWRDEIDMALDTASLVLLIISPSSMQSAYVTYEWSYSWFKLKKEPYLLYFAECDKSTGMFGRLRDFQLPMTSCLHGDANSDKLDDVIQEIKSLIDTLPTLKAALTRLRNTDLNEHIRSGAALELGRSSRYLKPTAYNYLVQGLEGQLSGNGPNGVVQKAIADALAELHDSRAISHLWRLYNAVGDYEPAQNSILAALTALSAKA